MSRIRANQITNQAADGAPTVQHGLIIAGVSTFTGSVSIGGTLTYEDVTNIDSIGIVTARGGIHIDDSIVHIGDTNTKIRFPAADTITAETGGAERLRIDSSGRMGLGTNNPTKKLTVQAGSNNADIALFTGNDLNRGLLISTVAANSQNDMGVVYNAHGQHSGSYLGEHIFKTNNTERLRLDSGGRLLINRNNNDAPGGYASKLQIRDTTYTASISLVRNDPGGGGPALVFGKSRNAAQSDNTLVQNGDTLGQIDFYGADGNDINSGGANITAQVDGTPGSNDMPGRLIFKTTADGAASSTERLRITSGGQVNIGTSGTLKAEINNSVGGHYFVSQCDDNQNGFEIYQQHGATNTRAPFAVYDNKTGSKDLSFKIDGAGWTYHNTTSNGTTNGNVDKRYNFGSTNNSNMAFHLTTRQRYAIWEHRQIGRTNPRTAQMSTGENGSNQGTVVMYSSVANADVTGGVHLTNGATSWSGNSDMRLKNKTGDILNALEDINKIEPIRFTWKYGSDNNPHVGVSAQSVENVVPEAIDRAVDVERKREGDETEYMQVRYTELIPLSIAAIKELKAEVESLKAEIASLKSS